MNLCTGPISQACNLCWKLKKSCLNSSRFHSPQINSLIHILYTVCHRGHDPEIKEESRSPSMTTKSSSSTTQSSSIVIQPKCKIYLMIDSTAIGHLKGININSSPGQGASKCQRTRADSVVWSSHPGGPGPHPVPLRWMLSGIWVSYSWGWGRSWKQSARPLKKWQGYGSNFIHIYTHWSCRYQKYHQLSDTMILWRSSRTQGKLISGNPSIFLNT